MVSPLAVLFTPLVVTRSYLFPTDEQFTVSNLPFLTPSQIFDVSFAPKHSGREAIPHCTNPESLIAQPPSVFNSPCMPVRSLVNALRCFNRFGRHFFDLDTAFVFVYINAQRFETERSRDVRGWFLYAGLVRSRSPHINLVMSYDRA